MNCDEVFNVLTRGPFPTGDPGDEDVEAHLEHCADCWRLAEALRPALEVFQEAIPPAESRDLPGYWGDARPASDLFAELTRSSGRTAVASRVRAIATPKWRAPQPSRSGGWVRDVLIVTSFLAALSSAAIGLALMWQLW